MALVLNSTQYFRKQFLTGFERTFSVQTFGFSGPCFSLIVAESCSNDALSGLLVI